MMIDEKAAIVANDPVGPSLFGLRLHAPQLAAAMLPGQFVHMGIPGMDDHLLRRPFSVLDCQEDGGLEILYQVVGYGTQVLTDKRPGEELSLIGPVGRPWSPPESCGRALLVGGGVGAAPLFLLAKRLRQADCELDLVLGAQTAAAHVTLERFTSLLEKPPRCSTDDGSFGFNGFCTPLVEEALDEAAQEGRPFDYLAVCGPEPLMKIAAGFAQKAQVPCEVSMERRMACGIGACLSCIVETTAGRARACVDGPIFPADEVVWS